MFDEYFTDFSADKKDSLAERGLILQVDANKKSRLVEIDRLQFSRLVENLLENSLKYRRGEVANVRINFVDEGKFLRVNFADDGRGVAENELEKIFESFYRGDKSRTEVAKGSGLGLAIVTIRSPIVEEIDNDEKNSVGGR